MASIYVTITLGLLIDCPGVSSNTYGMILLGHLWRANDETVRRCLSDVTGSGLMSPSIMVLSASKYENNCSPVDFSRNNHYVIISSSKISAKNSGEEEAVLQRRSYKQVFWKYTADLQENAHAVVWFRSLKIILVDKKYDVIILSYNSIVFFVNKNNV